MRLRTPLSLLLSATIASTSSLLQRQNDQFAGYLIAVFSDPTPQPQFYLSAGSAPSDFTFLNAGQPVLRSTVGERGVRDLFLTHNTERTEWYLLGTDLDINREGFNWDWATRSGSRGLVVWESTNLVDWSEPRLVTVETPTAGMTWAPSAVYSSETQTYHVFWASRHYSTSDPQHTGTANLDRIRHATTTDFRTFSTPEDYANEDASNTGLIDQEFAYIGDEGATNSLFTPDPEQGSWTRFLKNETTLQIYQENSNNGIFGNWTRLPSANFPGYVTTAIPREGPAIVQGIEDPRSWTVLLDDYTEYVPYTTGDIGGGIWEEGVRGSWPRGLKHGVVVRLTGREMAALRERWG